MNTTSNIAPDQLYDYEVDDTNGNKVGTVDGVWVDDATGKLEFFAVKTGWLFGSDHVVPAEQAQISDGTITVPYSEDQIKNGPSFPTDAQLSPSDEEQIYSYYGLQRSEQTSPTGYAAGTQAGPTTTGTQQATWQPGQGQQEVDVQTAEEELAVGKRQVQAGDVRLRKVVRTEHQEVPVELKREEVEIDRIPAGQAQTGQIADDAFEEKEIDVPVMQEEPVVEKQARATGGVRLSKDVETQTQTVGGDVRRSDVEIEGDDNVDVEDTTDLNP